MSANMTLSSIKELAAMGVEVKCKGGSYFVEELPPGWKKKDNGSWIQILDENDKLIITIVNAPFNRRFYLINPLLVSGSWAFFEAKARRAKSTYSK